MSNQADIKQGLKRFTDEELADKYFYLVQCHNDFVDRNDTEFAENMMKRIVVFEEELLLRGLVEKQGESPKTKAEGTASTTRATMRITVQKFKPKAIKPTAKDVNIKTSAYFKPHSRFVTYQKNIRTISRRIYQFSILKEESKKIKKQINIDALLALQAECIKLVQNSVKEEYFEKVISTEYKIINLPLSFSVKNLDKFIDKYFDI